MIQLQWSSCLSIPKMKQNSKRTGWCYINVSHNIVHSKVWLKRETCIATTSGRQWTLSLRYILVDLLKKCQRNFRSPLEISGKQDGGEHLEEPEWIQVIHLEQKWWHLGWGTKDVLNWGWFQNLYCFHWIHHLSHIIYDPKMFCLCIECKALKRKLV